MKVIKHGATFIKPQIIKCRCGCEYEIEDSDVEKDYEYYLHHWWYCVHCPECGNGHLIDADEDDEERED